MSKRLTYDLVYDAPLAQVSAMLGDAAFRERVCEARHVLRHQVSVTHDGERKVVSIDEHQSADPIPGFARKFVGDEIHIVQQETWTSLSHADIHLAIPHKPGDITGSIRLVETDGRTTETVDLEVKVHIPLVGGKIEGLISDLLLKALKAEERVGRDYLAG
ncbi:DUF2505 domain-containing protein [Nocardioides pacificus]